MGSKSRVYNKKWKEEKAHDEIRAKGIEAMISCRLVNIFILILYIPMSKKSKCFKKQIALPIRVFMRAML